MNNQIVLEGDRELTQRQKERLNLDYQTLTINRWADLEKLFGKHGACGGCWCMWWRLPRTQFNKQKGEANRIALKQIVTNGEVPGIIAYDKGEPVAWCSVAPRETYSSLERSRTLKRIDDKPVWSVVCFFTAKPYRNKGLTVKLLRAAVDYVKTKGGKIVEGYPVDPQSGRLPDPFVYTGLLQSFLKVGFTEIFRSSKTRIVMRYAVSKA
jgi:GNAT superfamily N-acetyltransferase